MKVKVINLLKWRLHWIEVFVKFLFLLAMLILLPKLTTMAMTTAETHYRKLERMYLDGANINSSFYESTSLNIKKESAIITLEVSPKYFHALGAMHGSVYFKVLDDAAFFAVNSIVMDAFVLTTNYNINIVRPISKGLIKAVGTVKFASKNLWIAESTLFDEKERVIAFGTGHFAKSRVALTEEIGYKL